MKVLECAETWTVKGDAWVLDHYSIILAKGMEIFQAQCAHAFGISQDIDTQDLESPPIPVPHEDLWPPLTDDLTLAPCPLPDNAYIKQRALCDYYPTEGGVKPRELLLHEARICEILRRHPHKNIASYLGCIHDQGFITGLCFARYKENLSDRFKDSSRPLDASLCLEGVKEALDHLHSLGLNHNDINPCNIMLDERDVPVVIDFDSCHPEGERLDTGGTPGWTDGSSWSVSLRKHDDFALERLSKYLSHEKLVEYD